MFSNGEEKKNNFWRRMLRSQIIIIIGLAFIVFFSLGISKRLTRQRQLDKEIEKLNSEINRLKTNNKDLNELIFYLNSNDFLEQEARIKLGLRKEGEKVAIVNSKYKTEGEKKDEKRLNDIAKNNIKNNPEKWWEYFFKTTNNQ